MSLPCCAAPALISWGRGALYATQHAPHGLRSLALGARPWRPSGRTGHRWGQGARPAQALAAPELLPDTSLLTHSLTLANVFTDAWGTNDAEELQTMMQTLSSNLFAVSIFPYAAFLYYLTKSKQAPGLMLFGWYFLLAFVFATIPAGIYAKNVYGTTLANVDYLHGGAELLLTFTNLFIVLGTRQAIRKIQAEKQQQQQVVGDVASLQPNALPADDR